MNTTQLLFERQLSWDMHDAALDAVASYPCARCKKPITLRLREDGEGELYETNDDALASHIARLSDSYHAVARSLVKQCVDGHTNELIYVYGETQPARYVLVQAASKLVDQ